MFEQDISERLAIVDGWPLQMLTAENNLVSEIYVDLSDKFADDASVSYN